MAEVITRVCDMCTGKPESRPTAEETIPFGVRSKTYQVDVCAEHKSQVETQFAALTKVATQRKKAAATTSSKGASAGSGGATDDLSDDEKKACRAWAKEQGHKTPPRLPAQLVEEWKRAGSPGASAA